jgi:hypothetical protein
MFIPPITFIYTKRYFSFIKKDGVEVRISEIDSFVNVLKKYKTSNKAIFKRYGNNRD